jgi:hypothetical protein
MVRLFRVVALEDFLPASYVFLAEPGYTTRQSFRVG